MEQDILFEDWLADSAYGRAAERSRPSDGGGGGVEPKDARAARFEQERGERSDEPEPDNGARFSEPQIRLPDALQGDRAERIERGGAQVGVPLELNA